MIDRTIFRLDKLLDALLDDHAGNVDPWRRFAEIIPDYVAPFSDPGASTACVVRCGTSFLRHSAGPLHGYFWDRYGDDFRTPEWALLALVQAPPPPPMLHQKAR